jgi:integrase
VALATADDHAEADGKVVLSWAQAQAAARAWAAKQGSDGPLTVAQACEHYIADLRARKGDRAAQEAEGRVRRRILPTLGTKLLANVTSNDVRQWHVGLVRGETDEAQRRARDTANRLLAILKAALNLAFRDGSVSDDRAWRRVNAFKGAGEARKVILGTDELQRLVHACPEGLRELVALGAWTGARLGEITGARVRDLDLKAATLRVRGKTGGREIHLPPEPLALLKRLAHGKGPADPLATTAAGMPWTPSLHQRPFATAVKLAGLDSETTFYALRHSYISRALTNGVPAKAVADHCGTSMAMIERHYAKFVVEDRRRYAEAASAPLQLEPDEKVVKLRG